MGSLATDIRDRLGPVPDLPTWPSVSIVVLNRDGEEHLRRLLAGLIERTDYPDVELIVVDNGSSDGSLDFLRTVPAPFPISILANPHNESFSDANNQGAEIATGELLLFLNNDIEPIEPGWLRELVACQRESGAGAVGARLVYPVGEAGDGACAGYLVQTQEVKLRERDGVLAGAGGSGDRELFGEGFGENAEATAAIGACILTEPELFQRVEGFTHGYFYGGEDYDLILKLREQGRSVFGCGRAVLIHHVSSTSQKLLGAAGGPMRRGNGLMLVGRWGPRIWREYALGRLAGGNLWSADTEAPPDSPSRDEVLALGFCLRADGLPARASTPPELDALVAELGRRGHRHHVLHPGSGPDLRAYTCDVAVYLRGPTRHIPAPGQLNVLWALGGPDTPSGTECRPYDLAVTTDAELASRLRVDSGPVPVLTFADAEDLSAAVLRRAAEIDFPTRIDA